MDLLRKLTIKNLKLNKKRTIVTIIGIILSVALVTAVAIMYSSSIASLIKFETHEKGNFHVAYYDMPIEDAKTLVNNRKIEQVFLTQDIGYARLENSKNEYKPYAFVKAFTKQALENLSVKLTEGKLPENENEIVIPTHLKTNGRVTLNVGDTVTLDVGKRVDNTGYELTQNNLYYSEDTSLEISDANTGEVMGSSFNEKSREKIIDTTPKTYKIVGIIERPASNIESYSAPGYTFITYLDDKNITGIVDTFCKYTKEGSKDYESVTASILGIDENSFKKFENGDFDEGEFDKLSTEISKAKYEYNINTYLITLESDPLGDGTIAGLGTVVAIVCGIIVFTSVFCIKNSFDISISEKTKQYGMLKSIGATKKQIRKNVFFEATILGAIGVPLGLLLGTLASAILVVISNFFVEDLLVGRLRLVLSLSWVAFAVATGLGVGTIYLSALRSARKASKISPIDSIRNSNEIKINPKKIKTPRIINKIFGIGGEISYKNLKRNKKKYRTTTISITVSAIVFIALSYFMNLAFAEVKNELGLKDYNLTLQTGENRDGEMYKKILESTKLEDINNYTISKYDSCYITNPRYSNEYKEYMNEISGEDYSNENSYTNIRTINDEQYMEYIKKLGLNYEQMKDKGILIDNAVIAKYDKEKDKRETKKTRVFEYNKNDTIICKTADDKELEIKLGVVTDVLPFGLEKIEDYLLIIPNELYEQYFSDNNVIVYYYSSNPNKLQDDIDELFKGYSYNINNINENVHMMEKLYTLVGIFLYGFIIVITLIGVTNVFNIITTNMELRKPEFAMLKSVGMTNKEFNRMIRLETVFMGVKSLIFSIPIGIGLSYLIYRPLAENRLNFEVPINAIIIATVAVFLLIACIMRYSMGKISKQNMIETIRNENI